MPRYGTKFLFNKWMLDVEMFSIYAYLFCVCVLIYLYAYMYYAVIFVCDHTNEQMQVIQYQSRD